MKLLALLLAIGGTSITACSIQTPAPEGNPLQLGGITIGQSETSVIAALGNPQRREVEEGFLPITLTYQGLHVHLDEQGVGSVLSTNRQVCTPAKICPGMTYERVKQVYGPSDAHQRDGAVARDYLWNEGCWLRLTFQADTISSVGLLCSP